MQNINYIPNTFEEKMIHFDERLAMEQEALRVLTPRELEIINLKYLEAMNPDEVAQELGVSEGYVRQVEGKALHKLRYIILKQKTDIVDSKIGMTEREWWNLALSIASFLERNSDNKLYSKRQGLLISWAKDIIMWKLTSDERQILLWWYNCMPYSGNKHQDLFEAAEAIEQKLLNLFLEDKVVCTKANYKVRV